jgi:hypothetical protein
MARITSLRRLFLAMGVTFGGFIAMQLSRRFVFLLQGFLLIFYTFLVVFLITKEDFINNDQFCLKDYFKFLKGGLSYIVSNKSTSFFIFGLAIYNVTWLIWGNLIQMPLYFGYTGSDGLAGVLRSLILLLGIPIDMLMANLSKQFSNKRYPHVIFIHVFLFLPSLIFLLALIPINNDFNIIGFIFVLLLQITLTSTLFYIGETLRTRVMIDMIPSEHRNAVYSLIPTLISLFGIPLIIIAGFCTSSFGLSGGVVVALSVSITGILFIFISFRLARPYNSSEK